MDIKKFGAVLATIAIVVVRLPLTWILACFNWIDYYLIKLTVKLGRVIDCEIWREALYEAMNVNVNGYEYIAGYFEDLQEDLA